MSKYGLLVKFKTKPGKVDDLMQILLKAAALMKDAKGCVSYTLGKSKMEEDCIWVTEVWDTVEDHDKGLQHPDALPLIMDAFPLIDGKPESIAVDIVSGSN